MNNPESQSFISPETSKKGVKLELNKEQERLEAINERIEKILIDKDDLRLTLDDLNALLAEFQGLKREKRKLEGKGEILEIESAREKLEQGLNNRFKEFGSSLKFEISSPEVPENLTKEHLEVIKEIFGGNLEPMVLPKPKELHNFNEEYQRVMYPKEQTKSDKKEGLVSFRPDWWDKKAEVSGFDFQQETWSQAYLRSMKEELKKIGGSLILLETTQKPDYKNGKQHYGTKEGAVPSKDPLLSLFQEVFGQEANRFNHSWAELEEKLLPKIKDKIKEKILEKFKKKNLEIPDFKVILVPASAFNLSTTLFHPENSQTNTREWASTVLTDIKGLDSGSRLRVGDSGSGGASDVGSSSCDGHWADGAARLAVVFSPRKGTKT